MTSTKELKGKVVVAPGAAQNAWTITRITKRTVWLKRNKDGFETTMSTDKFFKTFKGE